MRATFSKHYLHTGNFFCQDSSCKRMKQAVIIALTAVAVLSLLTMGVSAHEDVRQQDRKAAMMAKFQECVVTHGLDVCKEKMGSKRDGAMKERWNTCVEAQGETACKERMQAMHEKTNARWDRCVAAHGEPACKRMVRQ